MATELGRFLSEQLASLPADHPDRAFLGHIERTTKSYIDRPKENPLSNLTPRKKELLGLIVQGFSNGKIAETLVLRRKSVEFHIHQLYRQMGLSRKNSNFDPRVNATLCYIDNTPFFENPVLSYFGENEITPLTSREKTIASYIGQGYTNQAVADFLTISQRTVSNHVNSILSKVPVKHETYNSRVVLALFAQTRHVL